MHRRDGIRVAVLSEEGCRRDVMWAGDRCCEGGDTGEMVNNLNGGGDCLDGRQRRIAVWGDGCVCVGG